MARKPPRRTRERILETSLALFNRHGEPHVTTADIADEMNISPGNLYYHFRNKDEITGELYDALDASIAPLLAIPASRTPGVEDLWLLLHLLFERMWQYRFVYRDVDDITSRNTQIAARFAALTRGVRAVVAATCRGMRETGAPPAGTWAAPTSRRRRCASSTAPTRSWRCSRRSCATTSARWSSGFRPTICSKLREPLYGSTTWRRSGPA